MLSKLNKWGNIPTLVFYWQMVVAAAMILVGFHTLKALLATTNARSNNKWQIYADLTTGYNRLTGL